MIIAADATSNYAGFWLGRMVELGSGAGMVFVSVSVTAMAGIPPRSASAGAA